MKRRGLGSMEGSADMNPGQHAGHCRWLQGEVSGKGTHSSPSKRCKRRLTCWCRSRHQSGPSSQSRRRRWPECHGT